MKIGFPAAGISGDKRNIFSKSFVESGLIGVCDTDTDLVEVVDKDDLGKSLVEWMSEQGVRTIVTPELKLMALKVFREQGIEVFKAEGSFLKLNVELLKAKRLEEYSVWEMRDSGGASCGTPDSDCGSCKSDACH